MTILSSSLYFILTGVLSVNQSCNEYVSSQKPANPTVRYKAWLQVFGETEVSIFNKGLWGLRYSKTYSSIQGDTFLIFASYSGCGRIVAITTYFLLSLSAMLPTQTGREKCYRPLGTSRDSSALGKYSNEITLMTDKVN